MTYLAICTPSGDVDPGGLFMLLSVAVLYGWVLWRALTGLEPKVRYGALVLFLVAFGLGVAAILVPLGDSLWIGVILGGALGLVVGLFSRRLIALRLVVLGAVGGGSAIAGVFWLWLFGLATGHDCIG